MDMFEDRITPASVTIAALGDITEGGSAASFRFTRSDNTDTFSVGLTTTGTASGLDYSYMPMVNFTAGGSLTADLSITPTNDSNIEGTETIIVTIVPNPPYYSSNGSATMNLFDDDTPQVTVTKIGSDPTEGGTGTFRISRTGPTTSSLGVTFSIGGTATEGTDFDTIGTGATIASGNTYVDVTVTTLPDNVVENGNESVSILITDGGSTYSAFGSSAFAALAIVDDPPIVQVSAVASREGHQEGGFTFTRTGGLVSASLTVSYSITGTATSGTDFTSLAGSVVIAASQTQATVLLEAIQDWVVDPGETIIATLSSGSTYLAGEDDAATSTIVDITASTFTLNSDSGSVTFSIPWDSVDPFASSETVALVGFKLVFAGRTFDSSNTTFASGPSALFASAEFTGIAFSITGITSFGYTSVSAAMNGSDNVLSAVQTGTSQLFQVVLADTQPETVIYFHQAFDKTKDDLFVAARLRVRIEGDTGSTPYTYEPEMVGGETVGDVASMVYNNLKTAGWKVELLPSQRGVVVYGYLKDGNLIKVTKSGTKVESGGAIKVARRGVTALNYVNGNWE